MLEHVLLALLTAVVSSLLTLGLAYWILKRRFQDRLEARLAEIREEFGREIQLRVREGIVDGVTSLPSAEVLGRTQRTVTGTAADLFRAGLGTLFGTPEADTDED